MQRRHVESGSPEFLRVAASDEDHFVTGDKLLCKFQADAACRSSD